MRRYDNPELKRKLLNHLASQYKILEVREPNHLSSYVTCRTRIFFDQKQALEPSESEVMLFAIGYGLQDVLTPGDATAPIYTKDGIIYRPDMSFTVQAGEALTEIKTTRKSAKNHYLDDFIPVTWLAYMKGGCYMRNVNTYDLGVLYLMGNYSPPFPQLYCDTFEFEESELLANWTEILHNKEVLDQALRTNQPPAPFQNCHEFECEYCRYKMTCEAYCLVNNLPTRNMQKDIDELWK